jgi:hypothetical protein
MSQANMVLTKYTLKYTNVLPTALGADGNVLNGVGYIKDKLVHSYPKQYRDKTGYFTTGFFPYTLAQAKAEVPLYVKGVTIDLTNLDGNVNLQLSPSVSTTEWIGVCQVNNMTDITQVTIVKLGEGYYLIKPNDTFYSLNSWNNKNPVLMRMALPGTGEGVIITVNEPIE